MVSKEDGRNNGQIGEAAGTDRKWEVKPKCIGAQGCLGILTITSSFFTRGPVHRGWKMVSPPSGNPCT